MRYFLWVFVLSLLVVGCGDADKEVQLQRDLVVARQDIARLKSELALRQKPEADAINQLQNELATVRQNATAVEQDLRKQLAQSGQKQVLVELAPLQDFVKSARAEQALCRKEVKVLAQQVVSLAQALQAHASSEEASKAIKAAQDVIDAVLDD